MRPRAIILLLAAFAAGCEALPAGHIDAVARSGDRSAPCEVFLVRGWEDLYSAGMDTLARELREQGIHAEVFRARQWNDLANALLRRGKATGSKKPLVLIGFSYGADDVVQISRRLATDGMSVDLLMTIDPVTPARVPANVRECYNFYQTNGVRDVFPWFRGVPLESDVAGRLHNVDLRQDRPDIAGVGLAHSNIARNERLHAVILRQVAAVCPAPAK